VPIERELEMISDYIQLEKVRYGAEIHTVISCKGDITGKTISPLLLIPFVENSFKHGASRVLSGPFVSLQTEVKGDRFIFVLRNSKPASYSPSHSGGIGLMNVKKRLEILYPFRHQLECREEEDQYTVRLELQLEEVSAKKLNGIKTMRYEVA
jgi:LytS/YehU family sensor histidine kinase